MPIRKNAEIVLVPVISGGGDGVGELFLGIALIAISVVLLQPEIAIGVGIALAGSGGLTAGLVTAGVVTSVAGALLSVGVGIALSGLMQLFIKTPGQESKAQDENIRANNDAFGPLQNTTSTQTPIPLVFGLVRVPGQFIGGHIKTINHDASAVISVANYVS